MRDVDCCSERYIVGHAIPLHKGTFVWFVELKRTVLGTYCWKSMCVDTVGPQELLDGKDPVKVKAGEEIVIVMDYNPKPNEIS
ncbi:hypothetical protein J4G37_39565, partial [Microvirga sp. 3-52]|nr:hypothetical protein [Microvirga sp. 3-52]